MLMPSIFHDDLFDRWFEFPDFRDMDRTERALYGKHADRLMKTDVHEMDGHYEVDIDLPGFEKDEITLELKDGYLTVSAAQGLNKDENDKSGKLIRQERYAGSMARSFFAGKYVTEEDVKASFKNGVLSLIIPKKEEKPEPEKKFIAID